VKPSHRYHGLSATNRFRARRAFYLCTFYKIARGTEKLTSQHMAGAIKNKPLYPVTLLRATLDRVKLPLFCFMLF
jgi:hypothetical protein